MISLHGASAHRALPCRRKAGLEPLIDAPIMKLVVTALERISHFVLVLVEHADHLVPLVRWLVLEGRVDLVVLGTESFKADVALSLTYLLFLLSFSFLLSLNFFQLSFKFYNFELELTVSVV